MVDATMHPMTLVIVAREAADLIHELEKELFVKGCKNWDLFVKKSLRIKKLEAALRLIVEHPVDDSKQWEVGCKEMKKVARAALGEKKDD
jgi:hypothetical protein